MTARKRNKAIDQDRGRLVATLECTCGRSWSVYDGDGWMVRQLLDWHRHDIPGSAGNGARHYCAGDRSAIQITTVSLFDA